MWSPMGPALGLLYVPTCLLIFDVVLHSGLALYIYIYTYIYIYIYIYINMQGAMSNSFDIGLSSHSLK